MIGGTKLCFIAHHIMDFSVACLLWIMPKAFERMSQWCRWLRRELLAYWNILLLSVGSIPARGQCFFRMRVVKIANCKTYLKNVFLALSRNAPHVRSLDD